MVSGVPWWSEDPVNTVRVWPFLDVAGAGPIKWPPRTETLYHRDDALLYIAYVMLIWAALIPADRWHCSLWP